MADEPRGWTPPAWEGSLLLAGDGQLSMIDNCTLHQTPAPLAASTVMRKTRKEATSFVEPNYQMSSSIGKDLFPKFSMSESDIGKSRISGSLEFAPRSETSDPLSKVQNIEVMLQNEGSSTTRSSSLGIINLDDMSDDFTSAGLLPLSSVSRDSVITPNGIRDIETTRTTSKSVERKPVAALTTTKPRQFEITLQQDDSDDNSDLDATVPNVQFGTEHLDELDADFSDFEFNSTCTDENAVVDPDQTLTDGRKERGGGGGNSKKTRRQSLERVQPPRRSTAVDFEGDSLSRPNGTFDRDSIDIPGFKDAFNFNTPLSDDIDRESIMSRRSGGGYVKPFTTTYDDRESIDFDRFGRESFPESIDGGHREELRLGADLSILTDRESLDLGGIVRGTRDFSEGEGRETIDRAVNDGDGREDHDISQYLTASTGLLQQNLQNIRSTSLPFTNGLPPTSSEIDTEDEIAAARLEIAERQDTPGASEDDHNLQQQRSSRPGLEGGSSDELDLRNRMRAEGEVVTPPVPGDGGDGSSGSDTGRRRNHGTSPHRPFIEDDPDAQPRTRPVGEDGVLTERTPPGVRQVRFSDMYADEDRPVPGATAGWRRSDEERQSSDGESHLDSQFFRQATNIDISGATSARPSWQTDQSSFDLSNVMNQTDVVAAVPSTSSIPEEMSPTHATAQETNSLGAQQASYVGENSHWSQQQSGLETSKMFESLSHPADMTDSISLFRTPQDNSLFGDQAEQLKQSLTGAGDAATVCTDSETVTDLALRTSFPGAPDYHGGLGSDFDEFIQDNLNIEDEEFFGTAEAKDMIKEHEIKFQEDNIFSQEDMMAARTLTSSCSNWSLKTEATILRPSWLAEETSNPFMRISVGAFMGGRTEALGSLDGDSNVTRPNFGEHIVTPPADRRAIALMKASPNELSDIQEMTADAEDVRSAGVGSVASDADESTIKAHSEISDITGSTTKTPDTLRQKLILSDMFLEEDFPTPRAEQSDKTLTTSELNNRSNTRCLTPSSEISSSEVDESTFMCKSGAVNSSAIDELIASVSTKTKPEVYAEMLMKLSENASKKKREKMGQLGSENRRDSKNVKNTSEISGSGKVSAKINEKIVTKPVETGQLKLGNNRQGSPRPNKMGARPKTVNNSMRNNNSVSVDNKQHRYSPKDRNTTEADSGIHNDFVGSSSLHSSKTTSKSPGRKYQRRGSLKTADGVADSSSDEETPAAKSRPPRRSSSTRTRKKSGQQTDVSSSRIPRPSTEFQTTENATKSLINGGRVISDSLKSANYERSSKTDSSRSSDARKSVAEDRGRRSDLSLSKTSERKVDPEPRKQLKTSENNSYNRRVDSDVQTRSSDSLKLRSGHRMGLETKDSRPVNESRLSGGSDKVGRKSDSTQILRNSSQISTEKSSPVQSERSKFDPPPSQISTTKSSPVRSERSKLNSSPSNRGKNDSLNDEENYPKIGDFDSNAGSPAVWKTPRPSSVHSRLNNTESPDGRDDSSRRGNESKYNTHHAYDVTSGFHSQQTELSPSGMTTNPIATTPQQKIDSGRQSRGPRLSSTPMGLLGKSDETGDMPSNITTNFTHAGGITYSSDGVDSMNRYSPHRVSVVASKPRPAVTGRSLSMEMADVEAADKKSSKVPLKFRLEDTVTDQSTTSERTHRSDSHLAAKDQTKLDSISSTSAGSHLPVGATVGIPGVRTITPSGLPPTVGHPVPREYTPNGISSVSGLSTAPGLPPSGLIHHHHHHPSGAATVPTLLTNRHLPTPSSTLAPNLSSNIYSNQIYQSSVHQTMPYPIMSSRQAPRYVNPAYTEGARPPQQTESEWAAVYMRGRAQNCYSAASGFPSNQDPRMCLFNGTNEGLNAPQVEAPGELCFKDVCCVGFSAQTTLPLFNPSRQWLQCSLTVISLNIDGVERDVQMSPFIVKQKAVIEPNTTDELRVVFMPNHAGVFVAHVHVLVSPVGGNESVLQQKLPRMVTLQAIAEAPNVQTMCDEVVDFGQRSWGSEEQKRIVLVNRGLASVPVRLVIMTKAIWPCFSFETTDKISAHSHTASKSVINCTLKGRGEMTSSGDPVQVVIYFKAPEKHHDRVSPSTPPEIVESVLSIELDTPANPKPLNTIGLKALLVTSKLHIPSAMQNIQMKASYNQSSTQAVPFRNAGNVDINLHLSVSAHGEIFDVNPTRLIIPPGRDGEAIIKFQPINDGRNQQYDCTIFMSVEPDGPAYEINVVGEVISSGRDDRLTGEGGPTLLCDKSFLLWGGIAIGKNMPQKLILRNTSNTCRKYNLVIKQHFVEFQILTLSGEGKEVLSGTRTIVLKPMQDLPIQVMFQPTAVTTFATKLHIKRDGSMYKYSIPLIGHGGKSEIVIGEEENGMRQNWIKVGEMLEGANNVSKLVIQNTGDRAAFIKALGFSDLQMTMPFSTERLVIQPAEFVLRERETKTIMIIFIPSGREEALCIDKQNIVGTIGFFYGDEIIRQQYRRSTLKGKKPSSKKSSTVDTNSVIKSVNFDVYYAGEELVKEEGESTGSMMSPDFFFQNMYKVAVRVLGDPPYKKRESNSRISSRRIDKSPSRQSNQLNILSLNETADEKVSRCPPTPPVKGTPATFRKRSLTPPESTNQWSIKPEHLMLKLSKSASPKKFEIVNNSAEIQKYELLLPGTKLEVTNEEGSIPPRSNTLVCISPSSSLLFRRVPLPWMGEVIVKCAGSQKVLKVQIHENNHPVPTTPMSSSAGSILSQSRNTSVSSPQVLSSTRLPNNALSSNKLGQPNCDIEIAKREINFRDTLMAYSSDSKIEFRNKGGELLDWYLTPFALAYLKKDVDTSDIKRLSEDVFKFIQMSGSLEPQQQTQVPVLFEPSERGSYTQFWNLQVQGRTASSTVGVYRLQLTGKGVVKVMKSSPKPDRKSRISFEKEKENMNTLRPIVATPDKLIFPITTPNSTHELKVGIKNKSCKNQCIRVLPLSPPFHAGKRKFEVNSQHYIRLPIKFTPVTVGKFEAVLVLQAKDVPEVTVTLYGEAVSDSV